MLSTSRSYPMCSRFDAALSKRFWQHFYDPASLTVKLKQAGTLRVDVVQQGVCLPDVSMRHAPSLRARSYVWQRKVLLCVNDVVWIEAQTVIPLYALAPAARHLLLLKNRPLGEILFKDPHLQRSAFSLQWDHARPMRHSHFRYCDSLIYLQELFYPAAIDYFS